MEHIKVSTENYKCVIIVNDESPTGIIANIASCISMTLGHNIPELIGKDVIDSDGCLHRGITQLPIPILGASPDVIREIRQRVLTCDDRDAFFVDFTTLAQSCRTYQEYENKISETSESNLLYIGIGIFAHKKIINKCTGNLRLIR